MVRTKRPDRVKKRTLLVCGGDYGDNPLFVVSVDRLKDSELGAINDVAEKRDWVLREMEAAHTKDFQGFKRLLKSIP